jgi:hypothetical protein
MPASRKIWAALVTVIGVLWFLGGLFGYFEGHLSALILLVCGYGLIRYGRNLGRPPQA